MKNISTRFLKNNQRILETLKTIITICKKMDIDHLIIGAFARDILMSGEYNYSQLRATRDLDIAVLMEGYWQYQNLMNELCDNHGWKQSNEPHRLETNKGEIIDILPFGGIESEKRTVTFKGKDIVEMSVIGFNESYKTNEIVQLDDGSVIKITSLANLCLLKLIAWSYNNTRTRDIQDFVFILDKYADIFQDAIFNDYPDLLDNGWSINVSAKLLGIHIENTLKKGWQLRMHFTSILDDAIQGKNELLQVITIENKAPIVSNKKMLGAILEGIDYAQS